jgi:glycosyltransferase involved in cell wall biosynthesis
MFIIKKKTKGVQFLKNYGKSMALSEGFKLAKGKIVITMDADLQDDPKEIIPLYKMITENNYDIVSGWKKKRYDSLIFKNLPSKLFNFAARLSSGISLNDFNCGIKAYKSDVIKEIELTRGMHRYIPVLAKKSGFHKIAEKIVKHHPRVHGNTKYGPDRFIKGFLDLITLSFFSRFGKRPMHFFGLFGTLILVVGFFFSIYLGIDKLFINNTGRLITERPEFYVSLASMIIGSQFFLTGFLGELILRNSKKAKNYKIKSRLNYE